MSKVLRTDALKESVGHVITSVQLCEFACIALKILSNPHVTRAKYQKDKLSVDIKPFVQLTNLNPETMIILILNLQLLSPNEI